MYTVTKEIHFCYGHRLLDYDGPCRHLHGHNARAVITLAADSLDELGMVVDFSEIKRVIQTWVDAEIDHTMLMHRDDPFLPSMRQAGERVYVMDANPTAENIARLIHEYAVAEGFNVVEVALWETPTACATYRP